MTDKREEVLRKLAGFERDWMGGDNLSIVFCGLIESHLELDQDPDSDHGWHEHVEAECDATLAKLTDAIMNLFSGAGVVSVPRELLANCAAVLSEFGASEIPDWDEAPDTAVTIRPSAQRRGLDDLRDMTLGVGDFTAARHYGAALTAALSTSRSEEAREVPPYIRERADAEIAEIKASIGRDEPTVTVDIHGGGIAGVDESIAPLVKLLNDGGIKTVASCSGHGHRPGNIALADGRELIIARNWNEARIIDGLFPGINGEPAKGVKGALEFIRQSNEEIKGDFERVLLDAITVSEFGDRAAAIRERIREVRRSLTNGGK